eukprot:TRINITY_DN10235_c0_g1_i2.p1 TRINITY_DN10235_c0_g1~~TRINITY_DN10235_c0_g1_i2.p1  ORF type:complete len:317 (-),score=74.74 TRINITY_DN10235_c0_g1_i2:187-1137(-)
MTDTQDTEPKTKHISIDLKKDDHPSKDIDMEDFAGKLQDQIPDLKISQIKQLETLAVPLTDFYDALAECEAKREQYLKWKIDDLAIIATMREVAEAFDATKKKVGRSKIATGSLGIASGLAIVGGIIAAPFTLGASLGLTIGGIVGGVTSGVASVGTTIVATKEDREHLQQVRDKSEQRDRETKEIVDLAVRVSDAMGQLRKSLENLSSDLQDPNYLLIAASVAWTSFSVSRTLATTLNFGTVLPFVGQIVSTAIQSAPITGSLASTATGAMALPVISSVIGAGGAIAQGIASFGGVIGIGLVVFKLKTKFQVENE